MTTEERKELAAKYLPLAKRIVGEMCRWRRSRVLRADELLSSAYYGLAQAATRYTPPGPFGAYAARWIKGQVRRDVDKGWRLAEALSFFGELPDVPRREAGGPDVSGYLAALTGPQHEAVEACYLRGLTHQEAAAEIGVSAKAVNQRLEWARRAMRKVVVV